MLAMYISMIGWSFIWIGGATGEDLLTYHGTSRWNGLISIGDVTTIDIEDELLRAFQYEFRRVRDVKVKEIRGSEIQYVISVAEVPDEQQPGTLIMKNPIENRLRESYKKAALRRDALIFNYNFFTGFPDVIKTDKCQPKCGEMANCMKTNGMYQCECYPGFQMDNEGTCIDINECTLAVPPCEKCTNTEGSYRCECNPGFKLMFNGMCDDINECENIPCHGKQTCTNLIGGYKCLCARGYYTYLDGKNKTLCLDINECLNDKKVCHITATCRNTAGSNICICGDGRQVRSNESCDNCKQGYKWNGIGCVDVDECKAPSSVKCHEKGECQNRKGGYECVCSLGYRGDGVKSCVDEVRCEKGYKKYGEGMKTICADIDECTISNGNCDLYASCTNSEGSYKCECAAGYIGNGFKCQLDLDVGRGIDVVEKPKSQLCNKYYGLNSGISEGTVTCHAQATCEMDDDWLIYECVCKAGYTGDAVTTCTDMDECKGRMNSCHVRAQCTNTEGSYTCECLNGFSGTGFDCTDIDECEDSSLNNCNKNAICIDEQGSYTCKCKEGLFGDGSTCTPVILFKGVVELNSKYTFSPGLLDTKSQPYQSLASNVVDELFKYYSWQVSNVFDVIVNSFTPGSVLVEHTIVTVGGDGVQLKKSYQSAMKYEKSTLLKGLPKRLVMQSLPFDNSSLTGISAMRIGRAIVDVVSERSKITDMEKSFSSMIAINPFVVKKYEKMLRQDVGSSNSTVQEEIKGRLQRELFLAHTHDNSYIKEVEVKSIELSSVYMLQQVQDVAPLETKFYQASIFVRGTVELPAPYSDAYYKVRSDQLATLMRCYNFLLWDNETEVSDGKMKTEIEIDLEGPINVVLLDIRRATMAEKLNSDNLGNWNLVADHLIAVKADPNDSTARNIDEKYLRDSYLAGKSWAGVGSLPWDIREIPGAIGKEKYRMALAEEWQSLAKEVFLIAMYDIEVEGNANTIKPLMEKDLVQSFSNSVKNRKNMGAEYSSFVGLPKRLIMTEMVSYMDVPKSKETSTLEDKALKLTFNASIYLMPSISGYPLTDLDSDDPDFKSAEGIFGYELEQAYNKGLRKTNPNIQIQEIELKVIDFRYPNPQEMSRKFSRRNSNTNVIVDHEIVVTTPAKSAKPVITTTTLTDAYIYSVVKDLFSKNLFVGNPFNMRLVDVEYETKEPVVTPGITSTATPITVRTTTPGIPTLTQWVSTTVSPTTDKQPCSLSVSQLVTIVRILNEAPLMDPYQIEKMIDMLETETRSILKALAWSPDVFNHIQRDTVNLLRRILERKSLL